MRKSLLILIALFFASCTAVPNRYIKDLSVSSNGGYLIEEEDLFGFFLDVFYKSYSFAPSPDDNLEEAIRYFERIAKEQASIRKKNINPIRKSQLKINSTRNIIDGYYSIYVTGRVEYQSLDD